MTFSSFPGCQSTSVMRSTLKGNNLLSRNQFSPLRADPFSMNKFSPLRTLTPDEEESKSEIGRVASLESEPVYLNNWQLATHCHSNITETQNIREHLC